MLWSSAAVFRCDYVLSVFMVEFRLLRSSTVPCRGVAFTRVFDSTYDLLGADGFESAILVIGIPSSTIFFARLSTNLF